MHSPFVILAEISHHHISRWWILILVPIVIVKAYYLKQQRDNTVYPDPQPSVLKHDLTKEKPILSPKVSSVSIQWSWSRESVNMLPFSFVKGNIFDLYDDGIYAEVNQTGTQLSYEDIDRISKNGKNLSIYTKLKTPTAIALKTKQIDEILKIMTSKGVELR